jgi:autophagy-related protein 27
VCIVCGIESVYNPVDDTKMTVEGVIPIAGNYETTSGKGLEPKFSRLKSEDTKKEGLRMELHGGQFNKKNQMAIIEFQCDLDRSGNEGFEAADGKMGGARAASLLDTRGTAAGDIASLVKHDSEDKEEDDDEKSLSFVSYGPTDDKTDLLRLNWRTKYACEDFEDDDNDSSTSSHWGFFTWFIIM